MASGFFGLGGFPRKIRPARFAFVIDDSAIRLRFRRLNPVMDERGRRRFATAETLAASYGEIPAVSRATGIARSTIRRGLTADRRQSGTPRLCGANT
jgi:hypothetical protein